MQHTQLVKAQFVLTVGLLLSAVILGGGRGSWGDFFVQGLALLLLSVLILEWQFRGHIVTPSPSIKYASWAVLLPLTLPLLQLLPIPVEFLQNNPVRREIATQLSLFGVSPVSSHYLSLKPLAAERALWSLLPVVAMYLSVLRLSFDRLYVLLSVFLIMAGLSIVLGMAQLAGGPDSPLRFYHPTNVGEAVGFFANRNHHAIFLIMALPITICGAAWGMNQRLVGRGFSAIKILVGAGLTVLLILGIALARSRAGLVLGMLAVLLSAPIILSLRRSRGLRRVLGLIVAAGIVFSIQFALFGILERLEKDPLEDIRWTYSKTTLHAAEQYLPLGSGLGTFRQAFQPVEAVVAPGTQSHFANHAHNDYAELWLEGGWPFVFLLSVASVGFVFLTARVWRKHGSSTSLQHVVARAAWVSTVLVLLHSLVDYPLRTTSAMTVFSMLLGIALVCSALVANNRTIAISVGR